MKNNNRKFFFIIIEKLNSRNIMLKLKIKEICRRNIF